VLNVSADGLLLKGASVALGDRVEVEVEVDHHWIVLAAEVRFVGQTRHGAGCGAVIVEISADARACWAEHYRQLAEHAMASTPSSVARYLRKRTQGDSSG
jgi:hypothetical protein